VTSDLRVRLQAAIHGIGIALLPEQVVSAPLREGLVERVLPEWSGAKNILHLVYPTPRGMLPSVRSLIDYFADSCSGVAHLEREILLWLDLLTMVPLASSDPGFSWVG